MRIGRWVNSISCEYDMQDVFESWLIEKQLPYIREFYLWSTKRRPDFLVFRTPNVLINVEAKCNDLDGVMRQLSDNSAVCKYSFAYIPDYCMTPIRFKHDLWKKGFGLIIFNYSQKIVTEVLEAHDNRIKNKELYKQTMINVRKAISITEHLNKQEQIKMKL